jgi:hypothetical protein
MGGYVFDGIGSAAREAQRLEAWAAVREGLHGINGQWLTNYHEQSVTFRHRRRGHNVRVTLAGEVYTDLKLRAGAYKSNVHKSDLKSALIYTRQFLEEHV